MYLVPAAWGMPPYARSGRRTTLHTGTKRTRHARPYGERNHRTPVRIGTWFRAADSRPYDGKRQRVHVGAD